MDNKKTKPIVEASSSPLSESEVFFRVLFENNIDAVYLLDFEGRVLNVNNVACKTTGYSRDELLQMGIGDIDIKFPKDRFKDFWSRNPMGSTITFETQHRHKAGHPIDVEVNGIFFQISDRKYLYGIARDITERKRSDRLMLESQAKLLNVIKAVNVGTWEWNVQSGEASFDEGSAALLGYTLLEMESVSLSTWMQLKHPEDRQESIRNLERHTSGETEYYETESRMKHKDGRWVWIQGKGKVISWTEDGKPLMIFGTHADVTARKQAEVALHARNTELSLTLKEVHHRIKNNMNSMHALLGIKVDSISDPAAIAALEDSRSRLLSLMVMYDKLFPSNDIANISARDYLSSLVDEVLANYPFSKELKVEKDFDDFDLDIKRGQALGLIMNELLTNILKYAFIGRDDAAIHVSTKRYGERIEMIVADNGCGLPESLDFSKSTGFGLQLIAGLTSQLSGTSRIERGSGTKVIIEFNL